MDANDVIAVGSVATLRGMAMASMALGPVGWGAAIIFGAGALAMTYIADR